jgi:hypothetical protein
MILVYSGRRAGALVGDDARVGMRIRRLLAGLQPTAVVGAAADGADLLVVEAALELQDGPVVHIVLPADRASYRRTKVDPRWQDRFDAALDVVERRENSTVRTVGGVLDEQAYRFHNNALLDIAAELEGEAQRSVALLVAPADEADAVGHLGTVASDRRVPVLRIDPAVDLATRPKCFIAMPYGQKIDTQRNIELDCNLVYQRMLIPALENAQLNYRRADEEIDTGLVLEPMIEWLADAELVIGDLATGNFNVGWELGLRHLLRRGQTLLVSPARTMVPFDVAALRYVNYEHDESGVTDDAAIAAWSGLAPFLARVGVGQPPNDSPVAAVMKVEWGRVERRSSVDDRWESRRQELALARDLQDADLMHEVIQDVRDLSAEQARLLRAEAGVGLVRLGHFADAQDLLREVVVADPEVRRPEAHVHYAQSLYRPKDAPLDALDRAESVLRRVLLKRQNYPEVRALLGAIAKRRLHHRDDPAARKADLRLALSSYRYDYERNLNLYYEGVNVVALGVALAVGYQDAVARSEAVRFLPAVRVAAELAVAKPDERYWATATLAECALHEHLLGLCEEPGAVQAAYRAAGGLEPPDGYLQSTLWQLDFLVEIGIPEAPVAEARDGLRQGAGHRYPS